MRFGLRTLMLAVVLASGAIWWATKDRTSEVTSYWGITHGTEVVEVDGQDYEIWKIRGTWRSDRLTDAVVVCENISGNLAERLGAAAHDLTLANVHFLTVMGSDQCSVRSWQGNASTERSPFDGMMAGVMVLDQLNYRRPKSTRSRIGIDAPTYVELGPHGTFSVWYNNDWGHFRLLRLSGPRRLVEAYQRLEKVEAKQPE